MADRQETVELRIATFNVENFGDSLSPGASLDERVRLLRPQLIRLRADILCLQEVDSQRSGSKHERGLEALERLLAGTVYESFHLATTISRSKNVPRDKHNLVVLSRFPVAAVGQIFHDLVPAPLYRRVTGEAGREVSDTFAPTPVEWERPLLHVTVRLGGGRYLHVVNVHLRAPRAAFVPGAKSDARTWHSMAGWAEGFFVAAVKSAGQALEARLLIDRLFDADAGALVAVCGDFNADVHDIAVRTIRGDEEDAGNPHLALRTLVPLDRSLPASLRFSVVHHGRPQMLDHLLVSRPLLAWYRGIEVHNEALGDELQTPQAVRGAPESFHAPVVAEFLLEGTGDAAPPPVKTGA